MYQRTYTDDWDFRDSNTKEYSHGFHTYPAMMIPQIARKLMEEYRPIGELNLLFDPYMGSGTSLVEASIKGVNSIGTDLNPLARFMSKVKTSQIDIDIVKHTYNVIIDRISNYLPQQGRYNYDHITQYEYWYDDIILDKLSYLTEILDELDNPSIRDFFKLSLSELIREASYTRNGEFKRYRMTVEKIETFDYDPFISLVKKLDRNIEGLQSLNSIHPFGIAQIENFNTVNELPHNIIAENSVDMVVTSPPYGDSRTTVAYGQFSRWANEWFRFENAKNLDNHLMGGRKHKNIDWKTQSINTELEEIKSIDIKRYNEVMSFLDDYMKSIKNVASSVRSGGRICYVVGNRTVKQVQIPLDYFTAEMFEKEGFKHDYTFVRAIPNKRMPSKTSPTNKKGANVSTMTAEYIVIMTKQ